MTARQLLSKLKDDKYNQHFPSHLRYQIILQRVDALYAAALERDNTDALLHVFVAQYAKVYRQNDYVENVHLDAAGVRCVQCSSALARGCSDWLGFNVSCRAVSHLSTPVLRVTGAAPAARHPVLLVRARETDRG